MISTNRMIKNVAKNGPRKLLRMYLFRIFIQHYASYNDLFNY